MRGETTKNAFSSTVKTRLRYHNRIKIAGGKKSSAPQKYRPKMAKTSANTKSGAISRRRIFFCAGLWSQSRKNLESNSRLLDCMYPGYVALETVDFANRQTLQVPGETRTSTGEFFQKIHDRPQTTKTSASQKSCAIWRHGIFRLGLWSRNQKI